MILQSLLIPDNPGAVSLSLPPPALVEVPVGVAKVRLTWKLKKKYF